MAPPADQALVDAGPLADMNGLHDAALLDRNLAAADMNRLVDQLVSDHRADHTVVAQDMGIPSDSVGPPPGPSCGPDGWCWQNPLPEGNPVFAVWASDPDHVWIVGWQGTLLFWDGAGWVQEANVTNQDLNGIWGSSATDVWAVGGMGTILHRTAAGWSQVASPTSNNLTAVWTDGPSQAFAVGANGTALHYAQSPTPTWTTMTTPSSAGVLESVWGSSNTDVWAFPGGWHWDGSNWTVESNGISIAYNMGYVTGTSATDVWVGGIPGAMHWDPVNLKWVQMSTGMTGGNPSGMCAVPGGNVWAATFNNMFEWSGSSWATTTVPASITGLRSVFALDATHAWVVGGDLIWNGSTWSRMPGMSSAGAASSVWAASPTDAWATSANGVVHWDGTAWMSQSVLGTNVLRDIWGSSGGVWTVGAKGTTWVYRSGSWSQVSTPTTNSLGGVWGADSTDLWAVGDAGTFLQGNGTSWTQVTPSPAINANLEAVWGSGLSDVWAVGSTTGGVAVIAHYDGSKWTQVSGITSALSLLGVWGADSQNVWAVGQPSTGVAPMLYWNGTTWAAADTGSTDTFSAVWGTSATDVWAVGHQTIGAYGRISHWDGSGWTNSTTAIAPSLTGVSGVGTTDVWAVGQGAILHH
jgi:hypothetical protein